MELVMEELERATNKNGEFHSVHEGLGVITEEYTELIDAIRSNNLRAIHEEATQVAAMAIRLILDTQK